MTTLSLTKLAAAAGGVALALTAGAGVAVAAPDLSSIVNTTCNYSQVVAALNAQDPAAAAEFAAAPDAQFMLQRFLASTPEKRQRMAENVSAMPGAQQYVNTIVGVANSCNNY